MSQEKIAIYGGGGFAREVAWLVEVCAAAGRAIEAVCFIDDDETRHGSIRNDLPVLGLDEARARFPTARCVSAIGSPRARAATIGRATAAGFSLATLVHPRTEMSSRVAVGPGTVICAGCYLTTNITLGAHVQINLDCTIGHDVVMGDFATLAPGVHVSGRVHLGKRTYVGTGAVIINGTEREPLVIGDDAVIGAGACVTKPVEPGLTAVGVPARAISRAR